MTQEENLTSFTRGKEAHTDFNPLEDFSFEEEGEEPEGILAEGPYSMPDPNAIPQFQRDLVSFDNADEPRERIEALFAQMPTLQRMLFSILDACDTPILTSELETRIEEMKRHHHSVYEPLTFCSLLERAGAVVQTDDEGTPLASVEQEPLRITIDGVDFWHPAPAPEVYWSLTEEGRSQRDSYRPLELITACYANEPQYGEIFTTCLEMAAQEGGASLRAIGDVVDDEPILQSPKRYAMYFIDKLEHAGAVEWKGQWSITEAGREYLNGMKEQ